MHNNMCPIGYGDCHHCIHLVGYDCEYDEETEEEE